MMDINKLAKGEPYFILRGQDKLAPQIIETWATLLENTGTLGKSYKIKEARAIAHEIRAWQERNFSKTPD